MRSCDEVLELISAALDGALSDAEQAALEEHLSRCPACSALYAELDGLHTAAAELKDVPAPAGFASRVMERVAADPVQERPGGAVSLLRKAFSRTQWKGWTAAAAVAVVVLGAAAMTGQLGMITRNASYATVDDVSAEQNSAVFDEQEQMESSRTPQDSALDAEDELIDRPEQEEDRSSANTDGIHMPSSGGAEEDADFADAPADALIPAFPSAPSAAPPPEQDSNADPFEDTPAAGLPPDPGGVDADFPVPPVDPGDVDADPPTLSQGPENGDDILGPDRGEGDAPPVLDAYCGVLTLTGAFLPEGLEDYEGVEDSTGAVTYTVPAEYFFSCLAWLREQNADGFTYDAPEGESAEYGLIIVVP